MNRLENIKKDDIRFFSSYKWLSDWEDFLTCDYWRTWRTKISAFQSEKELDFYTQRLGQIADLIHGCKKYGVKEGENADLLIKREEIRLQGISHEDWKKEYKFADVELKEMSLEEIDKDFGKDIDRLFDLKNRNKQELPKEEEKPVKKYNDNSINYQTWTKEQLISEINRLKAENEQLKSNQTLTSSEKQERLQQNQQKLEQIASYVSVDSKPTNSNNNFPTGLVVVGVGVLSTVGLIGLLIVRKKKK